MSDNNIEGDGGLEIAETEADKLLEALDSSEDEVGVPGDSVDNEPVAHEQVSDAEQEPEKADATVEPTTTESAISALKRDGISQEIIDKLTEEEVLELGSKRLKVQGDTDNAYRELGELKKSGKSEQTSSDSDSEVAEPAEQPGEGQLENSVKPFADIFGDDAAEALQIYSKTAVEPLATQLQAQQAMLEQMLLDRSRDMLGDRFPQLSTDDGYAKVADRMQNLVKTGQYNDINSLMSDAARIEFSDSANEAALDYQKKKMHQKSSGQMTLADHASTPSQAMTNDEREDKLLEALDNGMSVSEARRMFGG